MVTGLNSETVLKQVFDSIINDPEGDSTVILVKKALPYGMQILCRYDTISDYIFKISNSEYLKIKDYFAEDTNFTDPAYQKLKMRLDIYQNLEYTKIMDKFERHIKLACYQRDFILDNVSQANAIADELLETKTKIYSEFIAILGIFTAISFALMGSIQTFGTVFSKVDNPSSASIGYAIIAGAVYLVIMIILIIVLFSGMRVVIKTTNDTFPKWIIWVTICSVLSLVVIGSWLLIIK